MARNTRLVRDADPHDVFEVLRDGWRYTDWVVGTRVIRRVEQGWPQPGTSIHYTAGRWPFRKDDRTTSRGYSPDHRLRLEAHAWPTGTVGIVLAATPLVGAGVVVTLDEAPARGILKTLHNPLFDLVIRLRNHRTLRRLEEVVRGEQRRRSAPLGARLG